MISFARQQVATLLEGSVAVAGAVLLLGLAWGSNALPALAEASPTAISQAEASPAAISPPAILEKSSQRALTVGKALAERRAIFFGTYWCPFCDKERQALGSDVFANQPGKKSAGSALASSLAIAK